MIHLVSLHAKIKYIFNVNIPCKRRLLLLTLDSFLSRKKQFCILLCSVSCARIRLLFWSGVTTIPYLPGGSRVVTAVGVAEFFIALFLSDSIYHRRIQSPIESTLLFNRMIIGLRKRYALLIGVGKTTT